MGRVADFFRGVVREMRKTSWPKRKELFKYTATVLVTVCFMIVFFALLDEAFSFAIEEIVKINK